mgnify:CR=1 FL=1
MALMAYGATAVMAAMAYMVPVIISAFGAMVIAMAYMVQAAHTVLTFQPQATDHIILGP